MIYANHTSWWDGFVVHTLVHAAGRTGYAVMEEQNLARFRFLTRLGAISIRRGDRTSSLETLRYCASVLARPRASLLVFPQGRLLGAHEPLRFERGLEVLGRLSKARAVPVAIRYTFFEHEYPDLLVSVGEPHAVESIAQCEARLQAQVDALAQVRQPAGLTPVLEGRRSVADRWESFRGRGRVLT
ncbi:MAG: lysophospholipid acyltransferase family protein [Myxococcaceae bacterium]|nr:lysophospholipid acyltransferase family protein [Myxococcaceae bacterium]